MCSSFRLHQSKQQEIGCRARCLLPFPWLLGAPGTAQQRHHRRHERPDESLGDALGVHLPEPSGFDATFDETRDTIYCLPHVTRLVLSEQLIVRPRPVSYTHLRAHETRHDLVCRLLLEKKKKKK